jgi:hypothetical protein
MELGIINQFFSGHEKQETEKKWDISGGAASGMSSNII